LTALEATGMTSEPVHPFLELVRKRRAVGAFQPGMQLSEAEIRQLVEDAVEAPSSFNIQHWRFVAVRRDGDKQRLCEAAFGQRQVADSAVTFIILGDLRAVEGLPAALEPAVREGAMTARQAEAWVRQAEAIYGDERSARDEALRSCALAAMTMMLAAEARGLGSCPLSGFDPARVVQEFGIDERYVPVMLLAVGQPSGPGTARKPRLPVDAVLVLDHARNL
jgi:nitroreductase